MRGAGRRAARRSLRPGAAVRTEPRIFAHGFS
jgi:hypothetical protein